jgi:hypothetical protein
MYGTHEETVELAANKGPEMHKQTDGLFCHLEGLGEFLCTPVYEAARLASAICSKHNQGRRIPSTYIASEPTIGP